MGTMVVVEVVDDRLLLSLCTIRKAEYGKKDEVVGHCLIKME